MSPKPSCIINIKRVKDLKKYKAIFLPISTPAIQIKFQLVMQIMIINVEQPLKYSWIVIIFHFEVLQGEIQTQVPQVKVILLRVTRK